MNGKQARARRRAATHGAARADAIVEIRVSGWGPRWLRLETIPAPGGRTVPTTQELLDYCLLRGYVQAADGPGSSDDDFTFRKGTQYWRSTPGAHALYLASAAPDTSVPASLRDLR
jgi:hypothetical protein